MHLHYSVNSHFRMQTITRTLRYEGLGGNQTRFIAIHYVTIQTQTDTVPRVEIYCLLCQALLSASFSAPCNNATTNVT